MNILIRWYNQNRKQLFITLLVVGFIIAIIHFANYLVKNKDKEISNNGISSSSIGATTTYKPQESAISSSKVSNDTYRIQSSIIDNFMKYCNEGKVNEAYDLLSSDCKEVLFPTLEYFINNYQKVIFTEDKMHSIKNWIDNIYKISITGNMLATGKSDNGIAIEDYFTIVNEEKEYKININCFIKRTKINKSNNKNNIEIEVLYKDVYMDNVKYVIKAKNKTNKIILLDSGENTQNIYIIDKNNVKYMSYRNEIPSAELKVLPNSENIIEIKYSDEYTKDREIYGLVFNDIILDFDEYDKSILKGNYSQRQSIRVEL